MLKKQLLTLALFFVVTALSAQEYKPFKVGIHLGFAAPGDGGGGVAFAIEPAYRLSDEIAIGLRYEGAALAKVVGEEEGEIGTNGSFTLNGQYYLSNNKFRPFVGLGLGIFSSSSIGFSVDGVGSVDLDPGAEFGFYPRVGFDFGHFNMLFDYNIIPASETAIDLNGTGLGDVEIKNSYFSIKIGVSIGGGQK